MIMIFAQWLQKEIDKRGWNQAEFSRQSGIPTGQLSRILNGTRHAGPEPCIAIAEALSLSRQEVFRVRGWLLSEAEEDARLRLSSETTELALAIDQLPSVSRQVALRVSKATIDALADEVGR